MNTPTLHHVEQGSGAAVVLLHGFPFDHRLWLPQLHALSDTARIIAPDLLGFGKSANVGSVHTMEQQADAIRDLLDAHRIERALIGGLSMGGYVALAFAERHPERLAGLGLFSTKGSADDTAAQEGRAAAARSVTEHGMRPMVESTLPKLFGPAAAPAAIRAVRSMMEEQTPAGVAASALGMAQRPDRTAIAGQVNVPVLVFTGSADTVIPPAETAKLHTAAVGSSYVEVPGVGHITNLEAEAEFNDALRSWIAASTQ